MIYALNGKHTTKPPQIFINQVTANLYYTINNNGRKNLKDQDVYVFLHHIQRIEEKQEYLPSFDTKALVPKELLQNLEKFDSDDSILFDLDFKQTYNLNDKLKELCSSRLKIWSEFELTIRNKNDLIDQEYRVSKEFPYADN
mmetsp:Transcript_7105/g.6363  ORF Transcript_7105/g.6363 Transcript_7105/m.6363 type:complete len:142 (+) Transcript_7105:2513-2938(+)